MILAIIQARMSSSRLPGKVLKPLHGQPMLGFQLSRVKQSKQVNKWVVATSTESSDQPIVDFCKTHNIEVFRGSLENVLQRFYLCAKEFRAQHVVRLTGDCPLTDPSIVDQVIELHLKHKADYSSNCHPATFADGFDVEIMTISALTQAYQKASTAQQKEHVTPYLYQTPGFAIHNVNAPEDTSHFRLTVDNMADFDMVSTLINTMQTQGIGSLDYFSIIRFLQQYPELTKINQAFNPAHKDIL
ncbi:cytidylyltransferase domain-containing protein [Motilimonas pumila]|uniref:Spore coat protein n=1 Tax=Motilimonas pumila TaxID=2303987 RepID=A0A418YGQ6_9GAMM|nr:glycosyltransferase family protein [Motilimonas pumila]RJG49017.1 spore coat protein [Motilimonas pumila]